jgi:hypothetical protein
LTANQRINSQLAIIKNTDQKVWIFYGWCKNTTDAPMAVSKLLLVARAKTEQIIYFQLIIKLNQKI